MMLYTATSKVRMTAGQHLNFRTGEVSDYLDTKDKFTTTNLQEGEYYTVETWTEEEAIKVIEDTHMLMHGVLPEEKIIF